MIHDIVKERKYGEWRSGHTEVDPRVIGSMNGKDEWGGSKNLMY